MSTYYSLRYHVTFSTKHRKPWIREAWQDRLHAYLAGTIAKLDGRAYKVGGIEDHVHLLIGLKTTHCIADVLRELKKSATAWVHEELEFPPFCWQDGYAVFSVSPTASHKVAQYIENQREHHRVRSFREELQLMLDAAGVDYDPRFLD